jgi:hypothetical protein
MALNSQLQTYQILTNDDEMLIIFLLQLYSKKKTIAQKIRENVGVDKKKVLT